MTSPASAPSRQLRDAHWHRLVADAHGDPAAFERFYLACAPWVLRLVRRLVGVQDAEDVLTDVFLQAWRDLHRYEAARGSVAAWLSVIAHSRSLDQIRRRGSLAVNEIAADEARARLPQAADPASLLALVQQRRLLDGQCQRLLSPSEHEVIALAYFEELSQTEIAARLGMPLGTVKTRMNRAHRKLRLALAPAAPSLCAAASPDCVSSPAIARDAFKQPGGGA